MSETGGGSEGGEEDRFTEMSQRRKKKKRWFKGFVFMLNGLFPRAQNTQPCRSDVFKTCKSDK